MVWPRSRAGTIALVRVAVVASEVMAALCGLCVSVAVLLDWVASGGPFPDTGNWLRVEVYCALVGVGPVALGRLLRSRCRERLAEREAVASAERAALAREMHDVVGHEMCLIAVRATALSQRSGLTARAAVAAVADVRWPAAVELAAYPASGQALVGSVGSGR